MSGLTVLKTKYHQVYQNFEDDSYVNNIEDTHNGSVKKLKDIFYAEIDVLEDDTDYVIKAEIIAGAFKKRGPEEAVTGTEKGGTAFPFDTFIRDLTVEIHKYLYANPPTGKTLTRDNLKEAFENVCFKGDSFLLEQLIDDYKLEQVPVKRSDRIMWCFINQIDKGNIFAGMTEDDIKKLPCILGLDPRTFNEEYICFGHSLSRKIYKPSAMDAGMFEYWRPGGKTEPHATCNTYTGQDEFVLDPNLVEDLERSQMKMFKM